MSNAGTDLDTPEDLLQLESTLAGSAPEAT